MGREHAHRTRPNPNTKIGTSTLIHLEDISQHPFRPTGAKNRLQGHVFASATSQGPINWRLRRKVLQPPPIAIIRHGIFARALTSTAGTTQCTVLATTASTADSQASEQSTCNSWSSRLSVKAAQQLAPHIEQISGHKEPPRSPYHPNNPANWLPPHPAGSKGPKVRPSLPSSSEGTHSKLRHLWQLTFSRSGATATLRAFRARLQIAKFPYLGTTSTSATASFAISTVQRTYGTNSSRVPSSLRDTGTKAQSGYSFTEVTQEVT